VAIKKHGEGGEIAQNKGHYFPKRHRRIRQGDHEKSRHYRPRAEVERDRFRLKIVRKCFHANRRCGFLKNQRPKVAYFLKALPKFFGQKKGPATLLGPRLHLVICGNLSFRGGVKQDARYFIPNSARTLPVTKYSNCFYINAKLLMMPFFELNLVTLFKLRPWANMVLLIDKKFVEYFFKKK